MRVGAQQALRDTETVDAARHTVYALANFTADPLKEAFDYLGADVGVDMQLCGQDQILQHLQLLAGDGELDRSAELSIAINAESWWAPSRLAAGPFLAEALRMGRTPCTLPHGLEALESAVGAAAQDYGAVLDFDGDLAFLAELNDGPIVIDLAARVGMLALRVLEVAPDAEILAYDVSAMNTSLLRANLHARGTVTVYDSAEQASGALGALAAPRIALLHLDAADCGERILEWLRPDQWSRVSRVLVTTSGTPTDAMREARRRLETLGFSVMESRHACAAGKAPRALLATRGMVDAARSSAAPVYERLSRAADLLADGIDHFRAKRGNHVTVLFMPDSELAVGSSYMSRAQAAVVERLTRRCSHIAGLRIIDPEQIVARYGAGGDRARDVQKHFGVDYPLTSYAAAAAMLVRGWIARNRRPHKVIVVDCDDTLWQGECAAFAPEDVVIAAEHQLLQRWLRKQREAGMIICLSSKNSPEHVLAVFRQNPAMVLRLDDVAAWRISWERKSAEVAGLATELNVRLDSVVFIDDSPLECAEVRAALPDVLTLQIPAGVRERELFLAHTWAFDSSEAASGIDRTALLQREKLRREERSRTQTYADFIRGLAVRVQWQDLTPASVGRVHELLVRTNQFNTNGRASSVADLTKRIASPERFSWIVDASDRFGSYGTCGAALASLRNDTLLVESFVLSCRVLGRDVERQILGMLIDEANRRGARRIAFTVVDTGRNEPALRFMKEIGAEASAPADGETSYSIGVDFQWQALVPQEHSLPAGRSSKRAGTSAGRRVDARIRDPRWLEERRHRWSSVSSIADEVWPDGGSTSDDGDPVEVVKRAWRDVLRRDVATTDVSFFALGGTSIQLVHVLTRMEERAGRPFGPEQIAEAYAHPTIGRLADLLQSAKQQAAPATEPPQTPPPGGVPLSASQLALWFAHLQSPQSSLYNVPVAIIWDDPVAPADLQRAIVAAVRRHDVLRTTYGLSGRATIGTVADEAEIGWRVVDGREWLDHELVAFVERSTAARIDLRRGPVIRGDFIHWSRNRKVLLLVCHHIAVDFDSLVMLVEEIVAEHAGNGRRSGAAAARPFHDFASADQGSRSETHMPDSGAFWKAELAGRDSRGSPLAAQLTHRHGGLALGGGALAAFSEAQTRRLHALAEELSVTRFTLMLSLYALFLRDSLGMSDVVVGTPMSLRSSVEFGGTIGNFVNLIPIRVQLRPADDLGAVVDRCHRTIGRCMRHKHYPVQRIARATGLRPNAAGSIVDTVLSFHESARPWPALCMLNHGSVSEPFDLGGRRIRLLGLRHQPGIAPVSVNAHEVAGTIYLDVAYSAEFQETRDARRFAVDLMTHVCGTLGC